MLSLFLKHSLRYFARHRTLTALNVFGIALGITVFVSVQIVNHSALQSFRASVDIVAGKANLEIIGDGLPFDEKIYPLVRSQPGLVAATPLIEEVGLLADFPGEYLQILGIDIFSNHPFRTFTFDNAQWRDSAPTRFLSDPSTIAITRQLAHRLGLKLGDKIRLRTGHGLKSFSIDYLIDFNEDVVGANQQIAVMDLAGVQENFGLVGQLTRISCLTAPGQAGRAAVDALRAKLPAHLLVQSPDRRGQQVEKMIGSFQLNLTALSLISLLVGMFLIYNTVSTAVVRRRMEIGLLRALGLSRLQVRALFLGEALLLGLAGLALGLGLGVGLSHLLVSQVSQTMTSLYLLTSIREIFFSPFSLGATLVLGLGAVFFAAWFPAQEASRIAPITALQPGTLAEKSLYRTRRWLALAGLFFLCAIACAWFSLHSSLAWLSFGAALFVLLGFAFTVPSVSQTLTLHWHPRRITTRLAVRHFGRSLHRNSVTIAALLTALAMLVGISIMIFSFRQTVRQWLNESVKADVFISDAANLRVGVRKAVRAELEALVAQQPEVEIYDTYRELKLRYAGQPAKLASIRFPVAADHNPLKFMEGTGRELFRQAAQKDQVFVSENFARKHHVARGGKLELNTPHGSARFLITGIFYDYTTEMGLILMDRETYQRHWQDLGYNSLALYLKPGIAAAAVQEKLHTVLAPFGEYLVYSNQQLRSEVFRIFDQTFRVTYVLQTIGLLISGLGIFLNLLILVAERRREIGILRAVGIRKGQMISLVLQEAGLIGALGAGLGLAAGLVLAATLTYVINIAFFGWTIHWAMPWTFLISLPFTVIFTAIIAGFGPAWQAAGLPIADAVKME